MARRGRFHCGLRIVDCGLRGETSAVMAERSELPATDGQKIDSIIIAVSAGVLLGLIFLARGNTLPMHSVNDRSRWATVYSLAERGTYQIDESPWPMTIDRVQLKGHSYSSK